MSGPGGCNHIVHLLHYCIEAKGSDAKIVGVVLIIVGVFFAPVLIGVPILIFGIVKLFSK
jgi:hypothetical protein